MICIHPCIYLFLLPCYPYRISACERLSQRCVIQLSISNRHLPTPLCFNIYWNNSITNNDNNWWGWKQHVTVIKLLMKQLWNQRSESRPSWDCSLLTKHIVLAEKAILNWKKWKPTPADLYKAHKFQFFSSSIFSILLQHKNKYYKRFGPDA